MAPIQEVDALVVGAGFGGLWITHRLREDGFKVQCVEKGPGPGGVWYWNCYPGARVDSHYPIYQFTDKELWSDWTWSEKFPGREEIRRYFAFVEEKWQLEKNIRFNTAVTAAEFNEDDHKWTITCENGFKTRCRWFIPAIGFAAKPYIPPFKATDSFEGACFHSSYWPQSGIDLKGKRVAVVGTGASGVQIIQDIAKDVKQMTVYQRTPNTPIPMRQAQLTKEYQDKSKRDGTLEENLRRSKFETRGGFDREPAGRPWADDTPEQRREVYETAWRKGGFHPITSTYDEVILVKEASEDMWRFWAEKQGPRIHDPRKRATIVPSEPKYAFGAKRLPMEQAYFEVYNRENVDVIDISASPVIEFSKTGIVTKDEGLREFDIIVLATGFDAVTGGLTEIDLKGTDGITLKERWLHDGVFTNFGIACNQYPNMFMFYGPQAPTAFSNGPSCVELQGEWIEQAILDMKTMRKTRIETTRQAEEEWRKGTNDFYNRTLWAGVKNWYSGANIPGKKVEALNWLGGLPLYTTRLKDCRENGYSGFTLQ